MPFDGAGARLRGWWSYSESDSDPEKADGGVRARFFGRGTLDPDTALLVSEEGRDILVDNEDDLVTVFWVGFEAGSEGAREPDGRGEDGLFSVEDVESRR